MSRIRLAAGAFVLSAAGVAALIQHEANVKTVYLDPVGIPTVCVGHTASVTRDDLGKTYSGAMCADLLRQDTSAAQSAVRRGVKVPITQSQYDALVSFTFNVGNAAFLNSTLLRRINAGECKALLSEFQKWTKARGKFLRGLLKRRTDEGTRYIKDCP